ncbi:MAG TPA: squalene/phytoene synthase family protein [Verrucomicrobiales bacterium]|nr:squalene/phytoene synthase family protein [Verrucomicrobiales bacterium]
MTPSPETASAEAITRRSQSNLAFALAPLPKERRQDMIAFYAFCRVVDDIVDEDNLPKLEKQRRLDRWRQVLAGGHPPSSPLETRLMELRHRYAAPAELFALILDGMEMDLEARRYATFEELRHYCYRVAGAVGLVSIRIFGCRSPCSAEYAEQLGYALQLTNILRDVGEDAAAGRLYLPLEDLDRFGIMAEEILERRPSPARFRELMEFEADRTADYFSAAAAARSIEDATRLVAAETMRTIYQRLLARMRADGFHVFQRRYRLGRTEKAGIVAWACLRRWLSPGRWGASRGEIESCSPADGREKS